VADQRHHTAGIIDSQPAAFVVPFYGDQEFSVRYLADAVEGFDRQTDPHWRAIIVDDATPRNDAKDYLSKIEADRKEHIHVIRLPKNMGHGYARNVAVQHAQALGYLIKVRTAGFVNALRVAANRGHWCSSHAEIMMTLFYLRLADNLAKVGQTTIAEDIFKKHLTASYPAISTHLTAMLV